MKKILNIASIFIFLTFFVSCKTIDYSKVEEGYKLFEKGDYKNAQTYFEHQLSLFEIPSTKPELYFHYAYTHYYLKNYPFSAYYFKKFAEKFETSNLTEEAEYRSPESYFFINPNFRLSQEENHSARKGFEAFLIKYPQSRFAQNAEKNLNEIQNRFYQKELESALNYHKWKNYTASKICFQQLLLKYENIPDKELILFKIFKTNYLLAKQYKFRIPTSEKITLIDSYNNLINKHSSSYFAQKAKKLMERTKLVF